MNIRSLIYAFSLTLFPGLSGQAQVSTDSLNDFVSVPPSISEEAHPNVLINMSVETPMGGAAYNDQPKDENGNGVFDAGECPGRPASQVGNCYFPENEYLGYFDPNKCYTYNSAGPTGGHFEPAGTTNATHQCSSQWSGNFLNWATMTAIDEFIWTMTGGHRQEDTVSQTIIRRARKQNNNNWFPYKRVQSFDEDHPEWGNVTPSTVTPFSDSRILIHNTDFGFTVGDGSSPNSGSSTNLGTFQVDVEVCNPTASTGGLEANCKLFGNGTTTYFKPLGLIQQNANNMRFGVMAYSNDNSKSRHGGVLRANMKYVGPYLADGSANPNKEYGTDGLYRHNPEGHTAGDSGVINYINKFSQYAGFKSYDPVSELYYECLNYFKNRGPTPEFISGLSPAQGGFPAMDANEWEDPVLYHCQDNYIIAINDAYPWLDKRVPGTHFTRRKFGNLTLTENDYGEPGNADPDINATELTNKIGSLEPYWSSTAEAGCVTGDCSSLSCSQKSVNGRLGEVFGTCPPSAGRANTYYVAGLAYYANTNDLRTEAAMPGTQNIKTFMIDTQEYQNNPSKGPANQLWLTGKYGGFNDLDGDGTPRNTDTAEPNKEWDADGDGEPDNFVLASSPKKLVEGLKTAFKKIARRIGSGTAASVIPISREGRGAVYQAYFETARQDDKEREASWIGTLQALFVDEQGYLREDANGNAKLDGYETDPVVELYFDDDPKVMTTRVRRYKGKKANYIDLNDSATYTVKEGLSLDDLNPIWNAREFLSKNTMQDTQARDYNSTDANTRFIFTWIDDGDNVVNSTGAYDGELIKFESGEIKNSNYGYFNVASLSEARDLVNYIRGEEQPNKRGRTIDHGSATDQVMRLGDIMHSAPTLVATPAEAFDLLYDDHTYTTFRAQYANRRHVVYVGANDGMLHAFNGGFYDEKNKRFLKQPPVSTAETKHKLGAELWAYVPQALLPHLKWLADPAYRHVNYVDGPIKVFDANIFTADADHPGGWGTVLVAGMRFGGAPMTVDTDADGLGAADSDGDTSDDKEFASAYVVMDITNPEKEPKLLAEITDPTSGFANGVGFTTGEPAVFAIYDEHKSGGTLNQWYMVFGSGPNNLASGMRTGNAKLYVYDLVSKQYISGFDPYDLGEPNSFVGSATSADWDLNFKGDSVYFGIAGSNSASGKVYKLAVGENSVPNTTNWPVQQFFNAGAPVIEKLTIGLDNKPRHWVYGGTGRLYVNADKTTTEQQFIFGLKDPEDATKLPITNPATGGGTDLVDTTSAVVYDDGSVTNSIAGTFSELEDAVLDSAKRGWVRKLDKPAGKPSERVSARAALLGGVLFQPTFTPDTDLCTANGTGNLYGLYYRTGTGYPKAILKVDDADNDPNTKNESLERAELGPGVPSAPGLHIGDRTDPHKVLINNRTSEGATVQTTGRSVFSVGSGEMSWRELQ